MRNLNIILLATILVLSSCTRKESTYTLNEVDGVKHYHNSNQPANPGLTLKTNKLFTLKSDDENLPGSFNSIKNISFDNHNNIFLLDPTSCSIMKYDPQGNFLKSFAGKGNGPGELESVSWFLIKEDTVLVLSQQTKTLAKFDLNGNFIEKNNKGGNIQYIKSNSTKIVGIENGLDHEKGRFSALLNIYNEQFIQAKNILANTISFADLGKGLMDDVMKLIPLFTINESNIYLTTYSEERYAIDVLNPDGSLDYKISKNYRKIQFLKSELDDFYAKNKTNKVMTKHKSSIKNLLLDDNDNLWVQKAVDSRVVSDTNVYYDIFKDGVYQNTVSIDFIKRTGFIDNDNALYFNNGNIFHLKKKDNVIDVYKYTLK